MDFELTPEQQELQAAVRAFAEEVVAPAAAEADEREEFPVETVKRMAELGLFGIPFPEELGGQGGDLMSFCLCLEEIARFDSSLAITLEAAVGLAANAVFRFGTDEQKHRWLVPMARGEAIGAFALTEPGGGTDARAVRTTARLEGDRWVIDGSKAFITNSGTPITSAIVVAALDEEADDGDLTTIVVPAGSAGVTVGPPYRKVGWRASDTHEVSFDGCRVPADYLLGRRGRGYAQFLETLADGRVAIAALSVGLARGCLEESVRYAGEREAFGEPIGAFEAMQFKIADMRVGVDTARLAYQRAAWLRDRGRPFATEASIAKLYASEVAVSAAREAVQVHGGYGFVEEFPVARFYRDAKVLEIGEGTSEIQRLLIARALGLPADLGDTHA
ncbi:MAG TPA: acyl-CoA dehydrogenase family protein [Actinomycetota bacterium]|nr:acyl-CoA dehydrogenase family protein [Actinomycetota bacterium]